MRTFYPEIEAHKTGFLPVEGGKLYWEESGNPEGKPVVYLHGGPGGSGTHEDHYQYFDPQLYRIILFDQRNCGKSSRFDLTHDTTWHRVDDIEALRIALGVEKFVLFGTSWGSTLALSYAIKYSHNVAALMLHGIFLATPPSIGWLYQSGAHRIFPDKWEDFSAPIPLNERTDMVAAYYKLLQSSDLETRLEAGVSWVTWEAVTYTYPFDEKEWGAIPPSEELSQAALIEAHYFANNTFFTTNNWIIENAQTIASIPSFLVHGRYDMICPIDDAWQLHKALPKSKLAIIPTAGHSKSEPEMLDALIQMTEFVCHLS